MIGRRSGLAMLLSLGALAAAAPATGQPYRWFDAHGHVHYTDRPPRQGAVKIDNLNPAARYQRGSPAATAEPAVPTTRPADPPRPAVNSSRSATTAAPEIPRASITASPPERPVAPAHPAPRARESGPIAGADAKAAADVPSAADRELVTLSAMDRWLDRLFAHARREFGRLAWSLDDPGAAWRALARGFRRDELLPAAGRCLRGGLDDGQREAALALLRSPLVQGLLHLEDATTNPSSLRDYRRFVSRMPDQPPAPARIALVHALDREYDAGRFETEMQRAVRSAVSDIIRPLMSRRPRAAEDDDDLLSRGADDEAMRFRSVTALLFAYRSLSSRDLEMLLEAVRSPARARFVEVQRGCVRAMLDAAGRRASHETRPLAALRRAAR